MAKVKALYSYTYDYEGSKISFKCGDEFQLLAKVNNDWWHVRRWINQGSQDMYIPAVYVKEVGEVEENPLYQNMADLKKQVEEFKKKESSTPPPPTARKPRHDRAGSEKAKTQSSTAATGSPEHKQETESVADIAKKLTENIKQTNKPPDHPQQDNQTGKVSPLIQPKRSQSTRRMESPVGRKLIESGAIANLIAVAGKPRSQSISARPSGGKKEKESVSPPEVCISQQPDDLPTTTVMKTSKSKLPPPVLPKAGKTNRPKSMHMFSPTEGQSSEDPFSAALQTHLSDQMKKVKSVSSVGATTASEAEAKVTATPATVQEASPNRKVKCVFVVGTYECMCCVCVCVCVNLAV